MIIYCGAFMFVSAPIRISCRQVWRPGGGGGRDDAAPHPVPREPPPGRHHRRHRRRLQSGVLPFKEKAPTGAIFGKLLQILPLSFFFFITVELRVE